MSEYFKINSYTRVLKAGKLSLEEKRKLFDEQSLSKSSNYREVKKIDKSNEKNDYKKFCRQTFKNRKFMSQKEFHSYIISEYNGNVTWYRKRMIDLGLIKEINKLIKFNYENEGESEEET